MWSGEFMRTSRLSWLALLGTAGIVAGCGGAKTKPAVAPTPASQSQPAVQQKAAPAPADPIADLIALSERHYAAGERQLKLGHLEQARAEFDRAVDVLLESPHGGRSNPRLREHFDRLVDRINAHEVTVLAQGDGFTEKKYEAASIDALLEIATFPRPEPEPATGDTVRADLELNKHDIPIPPNSRVLSYVELFQGRLREYIQEGLTRGGRYLPMIQDVFEAEGIPLDLAYVPLIESAFKPNALSRAKAKGVWQFMRGTALENGLRTDWYIDERSDPEKATIAAAKYLKTLYGIFDDWHLALAAYNGGLGRIQRAMKRSGLDDFWSLTASSKYLPRETREYVPLVLAAMIIARNPTQYGLVFEVEAPVAYEKVRVPPAVDLRRVAEWTGSSIDHIQQLNPELRRWTTPVRYEYEMKVPAGTADGLRAELASASSSELTSIKWHTVKRGESLQSIARKLKVSRTDLAEANGLRLKSKVRAGQRLIIPRAPAGLLAARTERPAPSSLVASKSLAGAASTPEGAPTPAGKRTVYRVKRGDTLYSIAELFDTTVEKIKSWNRLRGSRITAGDRLTIFATRTH
jgi:membrane-bound lytic murein transglycosylase D